MLWQTHTVLLCMYWDEVHNPHISALRQEIKSIWVTQKTFCAFMGVTQSQLQQKRLELLFSMWWFKDGKKRSEGDIWTEVSLWKMISCRLAEGAGMSCNWRAGVDGTALLILLFISLAFFCLISIAILHWRAPFAAVHTSCNLYSK